MKTTQQPRTKGSPSTRRRRKTISSSATTEEDLNPLFPGPAFQVQYPEYPADTTPLNICFPFVAGCPFKQKKKKKILKKERIYIVYNHDDRYTTRSRTIPAIYRSVLIRRSSPEESCKKQLCITTAPFFFYIFLSFFFFLQIPQFGLRRSKASFRSNSLLAKARRSFVLI